jgi:hypothetical protein
LSKYDDEANKIINGLSRVKYENEHHHASFANVIPAAINAVNAEKLKQEMIDDWNNQLLVKDISWSHEKEWRLVSNRKDNKLFIDLVSAIYLNQEILQTVEGQALTNLANERKWPIYVRTFNNRTIKFDYILLGEMKDE